jgi:thiamine pyrophosphate-dependent acetolactate synthase large subunit-like protein
MMMTKPRRPTVFQKAFGCVGHGLLIAMGAVTAGKHPVVLFEGDTSIMMHLQELDTAARYKMPLLVVVMNDQVLGSEYHKLRADDLNEELAFVPTPDLGAVARSLGCKGRLVQDLEGLRAGLSEFKANPAPTVLDVRVARNVISVPYRRSHFGQVA